LNTYLPSEMKTKSVIAVVLTSLIIQVTSGFSQPFKGPLKKIIVNDVRSSVLEKAEKFMSEIPVTVTTEFCKRSQGGLHDFYSEGDYWWPDPQNPAGPYIRRDGESNPGNFSAHRLAMIRFSDITATLTSAWLLTGKSRYASKALEHFEAWFINEQTKMNPNLLYAQAISGRVSGRGVGIIDAIHLVEVARSVEVLRKARLIPAGKEAQITGWFSQLLKWLTTHPYGIEEKNAKNNHGTCWVAQVAEFARLTNNKDMLDSCRFRFKNVLLPDQMATDGSFPLEISRTKPYGYSLFNIDAMCTVAEILSTPDDNLWKYSTPDGKSLKKGMDFILPFIINKQSWPFAKDIYIWDEWPVRQSSLLFSGIAYQNSDYLNTWLKLPADPQHPEVIRNLPIRHPLIWIN
jgi:hypothetical protein